MQVEFVVGVSLSVAFRIVAESGEIEFGILLKSGHYCSQSVGQQHKVVVGNEADVARSISQRIVSVTAKPFALQGEYTHIGAPQLGRHQRSHLAGQLPRHQIAKSGCMRQQHVSHAVDAFVDGAY